MSLLLASRTELCAFSEFRIYPGHGQRFVRKDGQVSLSSSASCLRWCYCMQFHSLEPLSCPSLRFSLNLTSSLSLFMSFPPPQPVNLGTSKAKSMNNQRKKPALLVWTTAWRRLNKKGKDEGVSKKK